MNNNTTTEIVSFAPTYFYLSVAYNGGLKDQAARDSYKGLNVRVEYNGGERVAPGPRPEQKLTFFSGEFGQDYNDAMDFIMVINRDEAPVMASSTVDDYLFDAGYDTEENAADEAALNAWRDEVPFASDADLAADQANDSAWAGMVAATFEEAMANDLPFLPKTDMDKTLMVDKRLEDAWDRVPAAKLRWAIANVIASSDYNTSYPGAPLGRDRAMQALKVLDGLLADANVAAAR